MSTDPSRMVVMQHLMRVSATIEMQLHDKSSPLVVALQMARDEAAEAVIKLISADPENPSEIRHLQNHIARFTDLVRWLKGINAAGFETDREIHHEHREELADLLSYTPDGPSAFDADEAMEAGLNERGRNDA